MVCTICGKRKRDFYDQRCRDCYNNYKRERWSQGKDKQSKESKEKHKLYKRKQRVERVKLCRDIKREAGCKYCNESEPVALDFHHVEDKIECVSRLIHSSESKLLAEIAKCIVICANCHRKLHAGLIK